MVTCALFVWYFAAINSCLIGSCVGAPKSIQQRLEADHAQIQGLTQNHRLIKSSGNWPDAPNKQRINWIKYAIKKAWNAVSGLQNHTDQSQTKCLSCFVVYWENGKLKLIELENTTNKGYLMKTLR